MLQQFYPFRNCWSSNCEIIVCFDFLCLENLAKNAEKYVDSKETKKVRVCHSTDWQPIKLAFYLKILIGA